MKTTKEINTLNLHICTNHSGKMKYINSLSTAPGKNIFCVNRAKDDKKICAHCFSFKMNKRYKALKKVLEKNTEILTTQIIPFDQLPTINTLYFRFESFGDIMNVTQVTNYFNICNKNKRVRFALWTKNPLIVAAALRRNKKPGNLQIVLSSENTNEKIENTFSFVDKVFTVYDAETIEKEHIHINCGAKSCFTCHKCYGKNNVKHIAEKLK